MLVKWLGISALCVIVALAVAFAPQILSSEVQPARQVDADEHRSLVLDCAEEAEQKLKAMGPMVGWDPKEVRQKCKAAVDRHLSAAN